EYEVPYIRIGQRVSLELSYYPGRTYRGLVSFIYPSADPVTRTIKVRIDLPNPQLDLKPQMFATVEFTVDYGNTILVPQEAILDSGSRQTVFVARDHGQFEPRVVQTGGKLDGKVAILAGLKPGETIVTSGNFLIDSESRLKNAMGGMQH